MNIRHWPSSRTILVLYSSILFRYAMTTITRTPFYFLFAAKKIDFDNSFDVSVGLVIRLMFLVSAKFFVGWDSFV